MSRPKGFITGIFLFCLAWQGSAQPSGGAFSDEVEGRLVEFYAWPPRPDAMNRRPAKFLPDGDQPAQPNSWLRLPGAEPADPLLRSAQAKATRAFQRERCRFLSRRFPRLRCPGVPTNETVQPNDRIEDLIPTWMEPSDIVASLDGIPTQGKVTAAHWSADYWPTRFGLTSYRYAEGIDYKNYREAAAAYEQPKAWTELSTMTDPARLLQTLQRWSPAEKLDLTAGDFTFAMTNQQKREGESFIGSDGNVPLWMGICHGWAAAAIMVPAPVVPVLAATSFGAPITWFPDDIRAMVTLAWANGSYDTNFIGGRCYSKNPRRHENGRLVNRDCFDTNPATFHLVLGNLIGRAGLSFIMDSAYDHEVWNQPVIEYSLQYFNPLDTEQRSGKWDDVAVAYDETFKRQDRFQKPLTRGDPQGNGSYDDRAIRKVVGVIANVVYLYEIAPQPGPMPARNYRARVTYTYDLELKEKNGKLIASGGEWHENAHPDFLWVPQRHTFPQHDVDRGRVPVRLELPATAELTEVARSGARAAYPYCGLVSALASASNGAKYSCAAD